MSTVLRKIQKSSFSGILLRVAFAIFLLSVIIMILMTPVTKSQSRKGLSEGRPPMSIPSANRDLVTEVSGGYEAQYFFQRLEKPADWDQNLEIICELKIKSVEETIERIENNLASLKAQELEGNYFDAVVRRHHTVGQLYAFKGDTAKAIEHFQAALQIAMEHGLKEFALEIEERLGITQMRRGEVDNCIKNHNAKSCIFPISREGRHSQPTGSQLAIQHFSKYLDRKPEDLEVRWLLNIAAMTLGQYPDEVPKNYLIPLPPLNRAKISGSLKTLPHPAGSMFLDKPEGQSWTISTGMVSSTS